MASTAARDTDVIEDGPVSVPVHVVVVDDHQRFRDGLVRRLRSDPRFSVAPAAATIAGTVELVRDVRPDVVVLDLLLVDGCALDAHAALAAVDGGLADRIMVLTATPGDPRAIRVAEAIAGPVLDKSLSRRELVDAIARHAARE